MQNITIALRCYESLSARLHEGPILVAGLIPTAEQVCEYTMSLCIKIFAL